MTLREIERIVDSGGTLSNHECKVLLDALTRIKDYMYAIIDVGDMFLSDEEGWDEIGRGSEE